MFTYHNENCNQLLIISRLADLRKLICDYYSAFANTLKVVIISVYHCDKITLIQRDKWFWCKHKHVQI